MDYEDGSIMYVLLNESRKLNLRLLLATPSVLPTTKKGISTLTQCGNICFFQPMAKEARKTAEIISQAKPDSWLYELSKLKVGECIICGTHCENGRDVMTPVTIRVGLINTDDNNDKTNEKVG